MVRITEDLIRKRCEHNEGQMSNVEELSLHQLDIEKLEHLDHLCKELKILYLQSNLIPAIENVGKLKKLEYLNLALNNITRIENLEGCEFLNKLDLTVNFIGELTSVENLISNIHLKELFLTGNPCADYTGYRCYVVATLPQLRHLDGQQIDTSERIRSRQDYLEARDSILRQQDAHRIKRESEIRENSARIDDDDDDVETIREKFATETRSYTPESRLEVHRQLMKLRQGEAGGEKGDVGRTRKERRLFTADGRPLNINEPNVDFKMIEDEESACLTLTLNVWKFLDTSLIDVDIQPTYVRVIIKGKIFQILLSCEVSPSSCSCQRSQTTGQLVLTMPLAEEHLQVKRLPRHTTATKRGTQSQSHEKPKNSEKEDDSRELLEIDKSKSLGVDLHIVKNETECSKLCDESYCDGVRANSIDFVDDPNVPPLI